MSPTSRTQAFLRDNGWLVANCERKIPCTPRGYKGRLVTQDLYGFIDTLAVKQGRKDILAIQSTSASNHNARVRKILAHDNYPIVRERFRIEVWSWAKKRGRATMRKVWQLRTQRL